MMHPHLQLCLKNPSIPSSRSQLKRKRAEYENTMYLRHVVRQNPGIFTDINSIPDEEVNKRLKIFNERQEANQVKQNKTDLDEIDRNLKGIKAWLEPNSDILNDSAWVIRLDNIKSVVKCHRKKQKIRGPTIKMIQGMVELFHQEMRKPPVPT